MSDPNRKLLGKRADAFSREAVYELPDGIETETRDGYDVSLQRVLFEDVLLVTYHRLFGAGLLIVLSIGAATFLGLALFFYLTVKAPDAALGFGLLSIPFLLVIAIRLILRLDVVTVFGRRSKASLQFAFRKRRAREVYDHLCQRVAEAQREVEVQAVNEEPVAFDAPAVVAEELPHPFALPEEGH